MPVTLKRLEHVNLRTANLDGMIAWYGRVLGMHTGPRPGFTFPGAWLYLEDDPIIHLVGVEVAPGADAGDLRLEHFSISASGIKDLLERIEAEGLRYRLNHVKDFGIMQVNLWDPDGNHIHLDFDAAEAKGLAI